MIILVNLIIGILFATLGITILNCISEILVTITELFKARVGLKILRYNEEIEARTRQEDIRAIGFATTFEEEEDE